MLGAVEVAAECDKDAVASAKLLTAGYQRWMVSRAGKERSGAGWWLMTGPKSLSASLVPACAQFWPAWPRSTSALPLLFQSEQMVGGANFAITSAGTSRPPRYRLLEPVQGGAGAGVTWLSRRSTDHSAKPQKPTLDAISRVVQSPRFLDSFPAGVHLSLVRGQSLPPLRTKHFGYLREEDDFRNSTDAATGLRFVTH